MVFCVCVCSCGSGREEGGFVQCGSLVTTVLLRYSSRLSRLCNLASTKLQCAYSYSSIQYKSPCGATLPLGMILHIQYKSPCGATLPLGDKLRLVQVPAIPNSPPDRHHIPVCLVSCTPHTHTHTHTHTHHMLLFVSLPLSLYSTLLRTSSRCLRTVGKEGGVHDVQHG